MKNCIWLLAVLVLITAEPAVAETGKGYNNMQAYATALHPGWNLGNSLDATGSETSWGNPLTTKEHIEEIAKAGFKSIRVPVTWGHRMGLGPDYPISENFFNRVQEIVDWSLEAGLHVMVNMHHETSWIMNMPHDYQNVYNRYNLAWTQISDFFKDYPHTLMFEGLNEPRFSHDWNEDTPEYFTLLHDLNTSFHQIVRSSGGNNGTRPLVLSTLTSSSTTARLNQLAKTIEQLNDPYLIATIHYYGYWPFSVNIGGATTFDNRAKQDIVDSLNRAYNTFVAKDIPVIIGEYGLLGFDKSYNTIQRGEILKYFEYINYYAQEKGMPLMLWDNGQHYNRNAMQWNDNSLYQVITAPNRSANANTDSIYIKHNTPLKDRDIYLNLNGNTLVGVKHNEQVLEEKTDYEIKDNQLTIKLNLLEKVLTGELGVNAILSLEFSSGANWDVHVIYYDTPVLKPTQGITTNFYIPTIFNGDRLATMEAIYMKGDNAGPQNWTSFKEYNHCFKPIYETNLIQITADFFKEVKEQEAIKLRFHFWSGETMDYLVTKKSLMAVGKTIPE